MDTTNDIYEMSNYKHTLPTLYKYGLYNPLVWMIQYDLIDNKGVVRIDHGTLHGILIRKARLVESKNIGRANETSPYEQAKKEAEAEWLLKLKQGYKERLEDISPLITDINEILKPMKAQSFSEEKLIKKIGFPCIQQPKLNGLRAVLRWEDDYTEGEGIFKTTISKAVLRSKEGIEYWMPHITNYLTKDFFMTEYGQVAYDGELYKHGMPLNQINASCPMKVNNKIEKCSGNPLLIQFWCFDLSVPEINQKHRMILQEEIVNKYRDSITFLIYYIVLTLEDATYLHNSFLKDGFEGSIFRNLDAYYEFGKRPITMMKWKKKKNTECKIIDIKLKEQIGERSYITFVLKNDINDEIFESVPYGNESERQEYLTNKSSYIGKYATIEFYERSGVKKVPFHSNVVTIRSEADFDKNDLIIE